jgi:hypothetical protein
MTKKERKLIQLGRKAQKCLTREEAQKLIRKAQKVMAAC